MTTLSEFLLARIAEDEALARAAAADAATPWRATYGRQVEQARAGFLVTPEDERSYPSEPPDEVALHIARHDPDRVLAECEAKRALVTMHYLMDGGAPDTYPYVSTGYGGEERIVYPGCVICDGDAFPRRHGCDTIRHLAVPYADHPDYDEGWRP